MNETTAFTSLMWPPAHQEKLTLGTFGSVVFNGGQVKNLESRVLHRLLVQYTPPLQIMQEITKPVS